MIPTSLKRWLDQNYHDLSSMAGEKYGGYKRYGTQPEPNEYDRIYRAIVERVGTPMRLIGEGEMGQAYLLDNGMVLKLTTDVTEASAANRLKGKVMEGVAKIYDSFRLGNHELFGILQEHVKGTPAPHTDEIERKLQQIKQRLEEAGIHWSDPRPENAKVLPNGRLVVFDLAASHGGREPRRLALEHKLIGILELPSLQY